MHQIRFRLGLRPRPRWGSLQHSPDTLAGFKGPTSKGWGEEGERSGREERGRERRREEGRGQEVKGGQGKGAGRERGREGKENGDRPSTIIG